MTLMTGKLSKSCSIVTLYSHITSFTTGQESIKTLKRLQQAGSLTDSTEIKHVSRPGFEAFA
jgi:hypothetical protein